PAVKDATVVGVPDTTWGEIGAGCIVLREAGSTTGEELAAFLAQKLAKYKIPRRWLFVDALPRTPYGKVVKGDLRARLSSDAR
ncbi:MAG: long-chain fatty acid--CoA ligase, partial [Acidobacteria bacterium]|nr:long-chain fatty acid--CoA ligase [Acidobacteriota bacterium]